MTEHGTSPTTPHGTDQELDVRAVVSFIVGLGVVMVFVLALMYGLSAGLRTHLASQDPPPPILDEARVAKARPEPHLQDSPLPNEEMAAFRAEEDRVLSTYAIVDKTNGIARIPIDRAIDIVAEKGLPAPGEKK